MIEDSNSEETTSGDRVEEKSDSPNTADKYRNPRATRKGPDMPEDHDRHRTDPENDYAKPDGSEPRG